MDDMFHQETGLDDADDEDDGDGESFFSSFFFLSFRVVGGPREGFCVHHLSSLSISTMTSYSTLAPLKSFRLIALASLGLLANAQIHQMVNLQNVPDIHQVSHNQINQVDSHI